MLSQSGVCAITCSICITDTFNFLFSHNQDTEDKFINGVKLVKSYSSIPVGFAGFIGDLNKAEKLIKEDKIDFIGMSRALFADNDLINKTLLGEEHTIHKCLWDGKCFKDKSNPKFDRVYCCVNPKYLRPNI